MVTEELLHPLNENVTQSTPNKESTMNSFMSFCEDTPMHGIYKITKSTSSCKKITWLLLVIGAFFLAGYQILNVIIEYEVQHTAFEIGLRDEEELKFPDILLCDVTPQNHTEMESLGLEGRSNKNMKLLKAFSWEWDLEKLVRAARKGFTHNNIPNRVRAIEKIQENNGGLSFKDLVFSMAHNCTQSFKICAAGAKSEIGNLKKSNCCDEMVPMVNNNFGVCYVLKGPVMRVREGGAYANFGFMWNIFAYTGREYYGKFGLKMEGIFIGVAYNFLTEFDSEFIAALPGSFTKIALVPKRTIMLNRKSQSCDPNTINTIYYCYKRCERNEFAAVCACCPVTFSHMNYDDTPICEIRQVMTCLINNPTIKVTIDSCKSKCKQPCVKWTYEATAASIPYVVNKTSPKYTNRTKRHNWEKKINIHIFFSSLRFTEVTQFYTITLESLLGSIGGLFGIYLGGSLLAVLHVFFTMIDFVREMYNISKRRSEKRKRAGLRIPPNAINRVAENGSRKGNTTITGRKGRQLFRKRKLDKPENYIANTNRESANTNAFRRGCYSYSEVGFTHNVSPKINALGDSYDSSSGDEFDEQTCPQPYSDFKTCPNSFQKDARSVSLPGVIPSSLTDMSWDSKFSWDCSEEDSSYSKD